MDKLSVRKARVKDVKAMHELVLSYAKEGRLLPRSLSELYSRVRDFFVYEENGKILGCCGLHVVWEDLAEITSLAVDRNSHRLGIGQALVSACIQEAKDLGIKRVFVLTYEESFFHKFGFNTVDKNIFPQKIWVDCLKCPKFPECDEIALLLTMET